MADDIKIKWNGWALERNSDGSITVVRTSDGTGCVVHADQHEDRAIPGPVLAMLASDVIDSVLRTERWQCEACQRWTDYLDELPCWTDSEGVKLCQQCVDGGAADG